MKVPCILYMFILASLCPYSSSFLQWQGSGSGIRKKPSPSTLVFTSLAFGGKKLVPGDGEDSRTSLRNSLVYLTDLSPVANNVACTVLGATAAVLWLQMWITLAREGKMDSKLSRKIIHSGSAPLYLVLFPLFSDGAYPNLFAASVPLSQLIRLVNSARQKPDDGDNRETSGLVNAISRSGSAKEALQGPFYYNIILFLVSLFAFRSSIPGIFVISQMAAGDGMADIIGRRYGTIKWPFSESKSIAGTLGFVISAFLVSCGLLSLYTATGCLSVNVSEQWPKILLISVLCAMVEVLIPSSILDDNISVSLAAFLISGLVFRAF